MFPSTLLRYLLTGILALGSFATAAQAMERHVRKAIRPFVKVHGPPNVIKKRNFANDTVVVFKKKGRILYVFVKPDGSVRTMWYTPQRSGDDEKERQSTPPPSPPPVPDPDPAPGGADGDGGGTTPGDGGGVGLA
jgi:hypothetical protein